MTGTRLRLFTALAATWLSCVAATAPDLVPPSDPHIRNIAYDPDRLVTLHGQLGFQIMIEFAPDEHIENVSIGDALAWQVVPNKRANILFLKPLDADILTNMSVVTDQRRYIFDLDASPGKPAHAAHASSALHTSARTYVVRFIYPAVPVEAAAAPAAPPPPVRSNTRYSYTGARSLLPTLVFDDGHFTYFKWSEQTPTPAIFALSSTGEGSKGEESLVNYGVRQGYTIVEQTAPRFILRNGTETTTLINEGWQEPDPGPDAPPPFDAKAEKAAKSRLRAQP
ncbi:TrbG/VirB9 family P-type conjugative transfer protein [Novosphingobium sp.]|uniref:TrbG/VirB9 family P-type conjugative transfer protein n=1 Tax=Novosphingobium sp. TaxID=1874826 RepID=UPI003BAA5D9E